MVSDLVKKVRKSSESELDSAVLILASRDPYAAIDEFQRMLDGSHRGFLSWYGQEHVLPGLRGLSATKSVVALDLLKKAYICVGDMQGCGSFTLSQCDSGQTEYAVIWKDFSFPHAPSNLSGHLRYSGHTSTIESPREVNLTPEEHLALRRPNVYHQNMIGAINLLEQTLDLPQTRMEDYLPRD